ncbi:hypothetical protein [Polyangium spumosum]|uniref:Tetratricopeptide repeat protein n=1 Tax=Polyangium spumosum TaxID=889282 RepID=A0A6N7PJ51_9BACT|nr:hypothetical protein [Polyangium spumosum]MRG92029.1 hypothetical protein [Polyangium spumosum]
MLSSPLAARANDPAAADALFQAAKKLMGEKQFSEACPKFDASYKLDPTLGTLLNLADCYEKLGRTATAWSTWGEAMEKAQRDGDKRAEFARSRRDSLFPKLPKVVINVQNEVPGVDILWDQVKLAPAVFGVELPADPAEHDLLVLRDDGAKLKEERVRITQEGARTEITLDIEALDKANPRKVKPIEAPPPPPPSASKQRLAGFVIGGFGAAALITAGALEAVALAKRADAGASSACVNKFCTPDGLASIDSARTFAEAGQWIGLGGIVAAAVGVTLLLTAPPAAPSPRPATGAVVPRPMWLSPWAGPNGGGLVVGGAL